MSLASWGHMRQIAWQHQRRAARIAMQRLLADESGQDLIEYGLVGGLIALLALSGVHGVANTIINMITQVNTGITTAV
jgi:pilus assembly protein Flp/PilA